MKLRQLYSRLFGLKEDEQLKKLLNSSTQFQRQLAKALHSHRKLLADVCGLLQRHGMKKNGQIPKRKKCDFHHKRRQSDIVARQCTVPYNKIVFSKPWAIWLSPNRISGTLRVPLNQLQGSWKIIQRIGLRKRQAFGVIFIRNMDEMCRN